MLGDFSVNDDQNLVHVAQMGQAVSDKNSGLVLQESLGPDDLFEDVLANMGVDSREPEFSQEKLQFYTHPFFLAEWKPDLRVVEEVDVGVVVGSPGHGDALFLTSGQVDSLLANFRLVACRQNLQIRSQSARLDHLVISTLQNENDTFLKFIGCRNFLWFGGSCCF